MTFLLKWEKKVVLAKAGGGRSSLLGGGLHRCLVLAVRIISVSWKVATFSTWVTKLVRNSGLDLQHQRRHKSRGIWMLEKTLKTAKKSFESRRRTHMFLGCEDYVSISWFCEIMGPLVTK